MNFQDNLRRCREAAGFSSARAFAEYVNIPYTTYLNYENKNAEPKYDTLCKIAAALGVSTDELLGNSALSPLDEAIALFRAGGWLAVPYFVDESEVERAVMLSPLDNDDAPESSMSEESFQQAAARIVDELKNDQATRTKAIVNKALDEYRVEYAKQSAQIFSEFINDSHNACYLKTLKENDPEWFNEFIAPQLKATAKE